MARKRQPLYQLSKARARDLDEIMELERLCFASPWSRQVFVEELQQDFSWIMTLRHAESRRMLGFINYWIVHDEIHVLNVATHPEWRRRGLGQLLMQHAIEVGTGRSAQLVTLEVRRSNAAAHTMYLKLGFVVVGVREGYYENGEDALIMTLELD